MSTKIYNGYILTTNDFVQIRDHIKEIRPWFDEIKKKHLIDVMDRMAMSRLDKMALDDTMQKLSAKEVKIQVRDEAMNALEKAERSATYNYPWDITVNLTVIPLQGKTLALFYAHMKPYVELWQSFKWVKDYHYQNQVDKPEEIPDEEWETRKQDWELALPGAGIPALEGFSIDICDGRFPYDLKWPKINFKVLGTREERARKYAQERVRHLHFHKLMEAGESPADQQANFTQRAVAADRWSKSEEAKADVDKLIEEIKSQLKEVYD